MEKRKDGIEERRRGQVANEGVASVSGDGYDRWKVSGREGVAGGEEAQTHLKATTVSSDASTGARLRANKA